MRLTRRKSGLDALRGSLADRHRYERQIDRLNQRYMGDGGLWRLTEGEISLFAIVIHRSKVARLLARSI